VEEEKVISANERNLYRLHSRQQLLKMNGGINPAKPPPRMTIRFLRRLSVPGSIIDSFCSQPVIRTAI